MSWTGGAISNYDRTAQATGSPRVTSPAHEELGEAGGKGILDQQVSRTRTESITEAGHESAEKKEVGSSDESTDDDAVESKRRESLVHELARKYTSQSQAHWTPGTNPYLNTDENSSTNPNSPHFRARDWAKAMVEMTASEGKEFRTAGVCFQNMNVHGYGSGTDYQKDVANVWLEAISQGRRLLGNKGTKIDILRNFDGVVRKGEMLVVLGPPGSGCTTLLKAIAGETAGIYIDDKAYFNYQGISAKEMHSHHRGEAIYTAEIDVHFPMLTVGETLTFAAQARAPRHLPEGVDRMTYANHLRDVTMAMFGISHTVNTRVGNEYIRGVSGGERKRVTISEATLSRSPLQCWDNSTRGLDSANAVEFCKTLRTQTELFGNTACVSIYQSPQDGYDCFDKATVLYEGRQIYFGRTGEAKQYFVNLGFECPARQTTPDFLTSMTSPLERIVRDGFEGKVPRTPDEFAAAWKNSADYRALQAEIEEYKTEHPINGPDAEAFRASRREQQAKGQRAKSPYTLSYFQQIRLCVWRGWLRLKGDPSITIGALIGNFIMALIVGSVFYNLQPTTGSFYQRGALLFFACLLNAFASALEILTLYAQRPIVEKHDRYALYHPSAEAFSSMLCDLPYKVTNAITFNLTLYFLTNLRREPGAFFTYLLFSFVTVLGMSMIFRTIASASRTITQALVPAAILILDLVVFTGFIIPVNYMLSWCRWLNYVDPLAYAFESLMVNEFSGRQFRCTEIIPSPQLPEYANVAPANQVCSALGSVPGSRTVDGDSYLATAFEYYPIHKWRNLGIIIAFVISSFATYIFFAEIVSEKKSKGEVLVFRRGHKPAQFKERKGDVEEGEGPRVGPTATNASRPAPDNKEGVLGEQKSVFHWDDLCYDIKIKGEPRRILDHVDGWVKPGTLTALMGVSGAGKTTLLDALASRITMGVITGDMFVDGRPCDASFQRNTGYVQQQDLHLATTTVREALNFSAILRQPADVPREEKLEYVDEVIRLLEMEEYADAVVGVLGEGLNVEQRKRLTIGVELAAKPPLLLFVDEPTSGLDSQTSWAILDLLEKLTKAGQAVLCTIHQPSAMLFQRFDRLLFLAKGGKTVYFGDIGENSHTLTSYFERHGAHPCPKTANPAEWMLDAIGAAPGSTTDRDWFQTWRESPEYRDVKAELQQLKDDAANEPANHEPQSFREHAAPFTVQFREVSHRVFQQYWRNPNYIYSKAALCSFVSLFIGFVFFRSPNSMQGLQNQTFAVFQLLTVFGQMVQQTMPHFVVQRSLYEVRERPSKVYSWPVFMLSQIVAEIPWNTLMAVIMFFGWYYPLGLYRNTYEDGETAQRGALVFLLILCFLLFTCTFTHLIIAAFETAEAGGNVANLLFTLCLIFCGVLARPGQFPQFWIFLYRVSPFTYLVSALLSFSVGNTEVVCAKNELLTFDPPANETCMTYMAAQLKVAGYLQPGTENNMANCQYCPIKDTNTYLASTSVIFADRWRNFGLLFVYIGVNIAGALFLYWLTRVPKNFNKKKTKKE
ncbi:ABC-2 type transporter-domain-containing protein [Xylaria arbuscula]|nr:ABC-2 type transporter-domain-containing protein [Xylaria arbuscula]